MALGTLKRRLEKIEAVMPTPEGGTYQFFARHGDPCLEVEPPWGGLNILRVVFGAVDDAAPNIQHYAQALKAWNERGAVPLTVEEWRRSVQGAGMSEGADPLICADVSFAEGATKGKLPGEAKAEAERWETRTVEPRN